MDKNEKALGYLHNAKNVEVSERLNSESLISFEIAYDVPDAQYLELEGYIKFNGQLYVIKAIDQSDDGKRNMVVRAVHVYIELVDEYIDREIQLFGNLDGTLYNAVYEVLRDTHFSIGTLDSDEGHDFQIAEVNPLKGLEDIADIWNVDAWFNNRTVNLGKRGTTILQNPLEIRYGKNLKAINMPMNSENIITRLYPYGKNGLTIEGVNNGIKYIDSPYINNYKRPKCADIRWNDIDDPNELLSKAQKHIETVDKPQVSYQVDFLHLSKLGYDVYDDFHVGDEVLITHTPFGLNKLLTRVTEYTYYPFEPRVGVLTLSNVKESMIDILVKLNKTKNIVNRSMDKYGNIQFSKLDVAVQEATNAIQNAQTEVIFDQKGILAKEKTDPNRFVRINSAGIGVTKNGTTFNQALTADGLVITKGTVGRLDADTIVIGEGTTYEEGYDPQTIANSKVNDFINNTYNNDKSSLQTQIDGKIETYFQTTDPNTWLSTDRLKHNGDMWYNNSKNELKRYNGSTNTWELIQDQKAIDAYSNASKAQDTADKKRRVFVSQPVPPYDIGDLWRIEGDNDFKICMASKGVSGLYDEFDWVYATNIKSYVDGQISDVNTSLGTLETNVTNILSDSKMTAIEANELERSLAQLQSESTDLINVATSLAITTEKTNYSNALSDLNTYLTTNFINQATYPIDITTQQREAIKTKFNSVQSAKSSLINKITAVREANAKTYTDQNALVKDKNINSVYLDSMGLKVKQLVSGSLVERVALGEYATGKYGLRVTQGEIIGTKIQTSEPPINTSGYFSRLGNGNAMIEGIAKGSDNVERKTYILNSTGNGGTLSLFQNGKGVGDIMGYSNSYTKQDGSVHQYNYMTLKQRSYDENYNYDGNSQGSALMSDNAALFVVNTGEIIASGNFATAIGKSKNATEISEQYGVLYLHAYESPDARYFDEDVDDIINGECRVDIDPAFLDCIEPNIEGTDWIISCTPYSPMSLYVAEIGTNYIVFKDSNNVTGKFSWRISGIRKNFANNRFIQPMNDITMDEAMNSNWEDEL